MKNRVLIVDDNEMMQSFLQHVLASSFQLELVSNGEDALDALGQCAELPDLVLADYDLAGMNGIDLLRQIRSKFQGKPAVVILSGLERHRADCLRAGASAYITKPFVPANLQRTLSNILKKEALRKTA